MPLSQLRARSAAYSPSMLQYLLAHAGIGAGLGSLAGCVLLWTNALGLPQQVRDSVGIGTTVIVISSGVLTITPLAIATAIGLLARSRS